VWAGRRVNESRSLERAETFGWTALCTPKISFILGHKRARNEKLSMSIKKLDCSTTTTMTTTSSEGKGRATGHDSSIFMLMLMLLLRGNKQARKLS